MCIWNEIFLSFRSIYCVLAEQPVIVSNSHPASLPLSRPRAAVSFSITCIYRKFSVLQRAARPTCEFTTSCDWLHLSNSIHKTNTHHNKTLREKTKILLEKKKKNHFCEGQPSGSPGDDCTWDEIDFHPAILFNVKIDRRVSDNFLFADQT